jgi:hypothetical protein
LEVGVESLWVRTRSRAWAKGKAWVEDGEIVLDEHHVEKVYGFDSPVESERMAFELANLSQQLGDERAILLFVKRWGLLWHGADDLLGSRECRESLQDWWIEASRLNQVGVFYQSILDAKRQESVRPIQDFLRRWGGMGFPSLVSSSEHFVHNYIYSASLILQGMINDGLNMESVEISDSRVRERRCWWGLSAVGPGEFQITQYPPDLLSRAYSAFAVLIANSAEIRACQVCGKPFRPKTRRSEACEEHVNTNRSQRNRGTARR